MKILYNNEIDGATITASSEVPDYDFETKLNDTWLSRYGKTVGVTSQWIKFDFGSAIDVDYVAILGHNITSGATISIQANATDVWTSPSVDESITYSSGTMIYSWTSAETYRYWRITIDDSSNPDGYIKIGYVFIGEAYTAPGMEVSQKINPNSNSSATRTTSGQVTGDRRLFYNTAEFVFPSFDNDQRVEFLSFLEYVDVVLPFILLVWEDDLDIQAPMYCSLIEIPEIPRVPGSAGLLWTSIIKIQEAF